MASKSEEFLAVDDIEGILAVIDSDILPEQNNLETEFAATVLEAVAQRCSVKKVFLEISQNSQENRVSFLIKSLF